MCRNIRTLHNFDPAATDEEIRASALQYVRKVSGTTKPSQANEEAFNRAVDRIAHVTEHLLDELVTTRPAEGPRGRGGEARARSAAALRGVSPAISERMRPWPTPSSTRRRTASRR